MGQWVFVIVSLSFLGLINLFQLRKATGATIVGLSPLTIALQLVFAVVSISRAVPKVWPDCSLSRAIDSTVILLAVLMVGSGVRDLLNKKRSKS